MKNSSYFSFGDLFNFRKKLDRLFNPYSCVIPVFYKDNPLEVLYTKRAEKALLSRTMPLIVEMQLYFSCVVKKRVLFHDSVDLETTAVNGQLQVLFCSVESASCDPVQFANNYPAKRTLDSEQALQMRARQLKLDYQKDHWSGEFMV